MAMRVNGVSRWRRQLKVQHARFLAVIYSGGPPGMGVSMHAAKVGAQMGANTSRHAPLHMPSLAPEAAGKAA